MPNVIIMCIILCTLKVSNYMTSSAVSRALSGHEAGRKHLGIVNNVFNLKVAMHLIGQRRKLRQALVKLPAAR